MILNIASKLNNLSATTASILNDLSQKQTVIVDITNTLPTNLALLIQANTQTGSPVIDTDNNIRHVFSVTPPQASLYLNPFDPADSRNNHTQLTFDCDNKFALIVNAYNKTNSDVKYYTKTHSDNKFALTTNVYNTTNIDIRFILKQIVIITYH